MSNSRFVSKQQQQQQQQQQYKQQQIFISITF